jgi:hypothetical protein
MAKPLPPIIKHLPDFSKVQTYFQPLSACFNDYFGCLIWVNSFLLMARQLPLSTIFYKQQEGAEAEIINYTQAVSYHRSLLQTLNTSITGELDVKYN